MIGSHLLISFNATDRDYPPAEEISAIFKIHGGIETTLSARIFRNYFIIEYESEASALNCLEMRHQHYRQHGFIIEHDEIQCPEEIRGADSEIPSLLDLNDDCILHLLKFLHQEDSVQHVCMRLRRLYMSRWLGMTHWKISEQEQCLDRIFHCGQSIRHLNMENFTLVDKTLRFVLLRCNNIKYLRICKCKLHRNSLAALNLIGESLTELVIESSQGVGALVEPPNSVKNLRRLRISEGYRFMSHDAMRSFLSQNQHLTVIITPEYALDAGAILNEFPSLLVLACIFRSDFTECPPKHNLHELFAKIGFLPDRLTNLLTVRKTCPNLRYLRIERNYSEGWDLGDHSELKIKNLEELLPLEGLCLPLSEVESRLHVIADKLKFLFFGASVEPPNHHLMLSQYPNLEIVMWDGYLNGNFAEFLRLRNSTLPMTVLSNDEFEGENLLPTLKWVNNPEEIFGQFSIFSVPINWMYY